MKPLTREQERELIISAQAGDRSAADTLVRSNMKFAMKQAHWFVRQRSWVPFDEALQEALFGLYLAVLHYNLEYTVALRTYAVWRIRHRFQALGKEYWQVARRGHCNQPLPTLQAVPLEDCTLTSSYPDPFECAAHAELARIVQDNVRRSAHTDKAREVAERRLLAQDPDTYDVIAQDFGGSRENARQHADRVRIRAGKRLKIILDQEVLYR